MLFDAAYEVATSNLRFGPGTTREIDLSQRPMA